jgi:hypothetical protein
MTPKQQIEHLELFQQRMSEVLLRKGNDYANEDRLSNFKLVGQIVGLPPEKVVAVLIATKVVRLGNLLSKGGDPNNESISDTLMDMANYAVLEDAVLSTSIQLNSEIQRK